VTIRANITNLTEIDVKFNEGTEQRPRPWVAIRCSDNRGSAFTFILDHRDQCGALAVAARRADALLAEAESGAA
jgi:hypothetical protein